MTPRKTLAGILLSLSLLIGTGGVFASQTTQYDRITEDVSDIRELELLEPLDIDVQSREELRAWLEETLAEYPEEDQELDERILVLFGFIEPGTDTGDLESEILGEQIAGYYDPETSAMVVVRSDDGDELSANDEVTFAHEVIHALQDQHFDLMGVQQEIETMPDDQYLAIKSLIEGDASVGQIYYLIENPSLLSEVQEELGDYESPTLDSAPLYYSETLLFPYDDGSTFVAEIQLEGGWDAVNDMFANPPVSTEQILHPDKYLSGEEPIPVELDDPLASLGDEWFVLDENVMGEFITDVFLRNGGAGNRDARNASEGWGGDAYAVVGNQTETAFTWTSVWDTNDDADEFFATLVETESNRLGASLEEVDGEGHVRLIGDDYVGEINLDGDTVTYSLAETAETLDLLTGTE